MKLPSVDDIVKAFDHRNESQTGYNQILLHEKYDLRDLVPLYVAAFPRIRNWIGRKYIVFWITRYARENNAVVELAVQALKDKSRLVRYDACKILAYAQDEKTIAPLEALLNHANEHTRADAAAAIDAIKNRNHNFFVDRQHTGKVFWEAGKP